MMGQTNRWPSLWCSKYILFFHDFLQNSLQKSFQFIFLFFYKITKIKIKSFECPKSIKSIKKPNTWNIRLLVDDSFVPSSKQPSIIHCRLTDFKTSSKVTQQQKIKRLLSCAVDWVTDNWAQVQAGDQTVRF